MGLANAANVTLRIQKGSQLTFSEADQNFTEVKNVIADSILNESDIDQLQLNKADKATTLAGYGITDAEQAFAAGTIDQYRRGDKTWQDLATAVRAVALTGLSTVTIAAISATDTVLVAFGKLQAQITDAATNLADNVRNTVLTGLSTATSTVITTTDSVLVAFGKLQGQVTDAATNLAANVRSTVLTGFSTASSAVVTATDTVLVAFGKLQAQVNLKLDATANAVSATKLVTARNINGVSFDGTANITIEDATKLPLTGGTLTGNLTALRGIFTGSGSDYNSGGIELVGNGAPNTVFPTLGFHQPSLYGGSIQLRAANEFRFFNQGASAFANIEAANITGASFIGSGASLTALNAANISTGTLAVARGGTGVTTSTGTGSVVLSASPDLTGTPTAPTAAAGNNTTQLATTAFVERYKPGTLTGFTFANSWSDANTARYDQSAGSNEVCFRGQVQHAYPVVNNQAMTAALPVALRPAVAKLFICYIASSAGLFFGSCIVQVGTDGVITFVAVTSGGNPDAGSGNYIVHLDPIRYNL